MASTSSSWQTVKKHSRQLSSSSPLKAFSPTKDIKFTKFHDSTTPITLTLDGNELVFENHLWHMAGTSGSEAHQTFQQIKDQNKVLQEENQLLKFKLDVLLDMLAVSKLDMLNTELELQKK